MSKESPKARELSNQEAKKRLLERIRVNLVTQCWEWQKARQRQGYGVARWLEKKVLSHRLSYELYKGKIPAGLFVLHKCDNPPCCNPEHLFVGTKKDNRHDQIAKGRDPAKNATHCKRGHEFSESNTLIQSSGRRQCKKCKSYTQNKWKESFRDLIPGDEVESLKAQVSMLEEALKNYDGIAGWDAQKGLTKHSSASKALTRLTQMRSRDDGEKK
jgi:hypothetical protein